MRLLEGRRSFPAEWAPTCPVIGVHGQTHGLTQPHTNRAAPGLAPTGLHTRAHMHTCVRPGPQGGLGSLAASV